jgi:hypothetical protein
MLDKFKDLEHFILALLGIISILLCSLKGHGDVAGSIALICVGGSGAAAAKSIFGNSKDVIQQSKE